MSKYSKYQHKSQPKKGLNPIWRGVGCILMVLVPVISYWLTNIAVPLIKDAKLAPPDILGLVKFPAWVLKTPVLSSLANIIGTIPDFWLNLIVFIVIVILIAAVGSLLYTMVAQFMGPPRYSEFDAAPTGIKGKTSKR